MVTLGEALVAALAQEHGLAGAGQRDALQRRQRSRHVKVDT